MCVELVLWPVSLLGNRDAKVGDAIPLTFLLPSSLIEREYCIVMIFEKQRHSFYEKLPHIFDMKIFSCFKGEKGINFNFFLPHPFLDRNTT